MFFFMAKDVLTKNLAHPIVTWDGFQFFGMGSKYKADKTGFAGFVGPFLAVVVHMELLCLQISYLSFKENFLNLKWQTTGAAPKAQPNFFLSMIGYTPHSKISKTPKIKANIIFCERLQEQKPF